MAEPLWTLAQMRQRVRDVLRDDSKAFITDAEIDAWLNEALFDLAWRTKAIEKEDTGNFDAQGRVPFDANHDFLEVKWLRTSDENDDQTFDVEITDDRTFNAWKDDGGTPAHKIGRVFGDFIEVYPAPATTVTWTLRYIARGTLLAADADVPTGFPMVLQQKMINYGRGHGRLKERDYNSADRYLKLYYEGLPSANVQERQLPHPMQLVPEAGPFDTWEAKHI